MIYIDTSALLRGILMGAPDHGEVADVLQDPTRVLISSQLLWLEADRTAIRLASESTALAGLPAEVTSALLRVEQVRLDRAIIDAARKIPQVVKSLDAIHIATAESLGKLVEFVMTYDKTMTAVLAARGVSVGTASQLLA